MSRKSLYFSYLWAKLGRARPPFRTPDAPIKNHAQKMPAPSLQAPKQGTWTTAASRVQIKKAKEQAVAKMRRWVVKAGSQMVCEGGPLLMRTWMQQVASLRQKHHIEVIWVTSGAIASAVQRTRFKNSKRSLPQKQALSAIGQPLVMDQYNLALNANGLLGSQVLLTAGDMKDPTRRRNLQNTLNELLRWKAIPILNENDAVATDEIRFGDNDSLSSHIAVMMKAERLVLMTDVEGLFDADPKTNPQAQLIRYRPRIGKSELGLANKKSKSARGTGGMYSKLLAADRAHRHGIITHLVLGDVPENLLRIAAGKPIGTQIGGSLGSARKA